MLPNKPVWIERSERSCCIFLKRAACWVCQPAWCQVHLALTFVSLTNGELTRWGDWEEVLHARGLKGHTWETVLWCAYCLHESLHRPKLIVCCLVAPTVACGKADDICNWAPACPAGWRKKRGSVWPVLGPGCLDLTAWLEALGIVWGTQLKWKRDWDHC